MQQLVITRLDGRIVSTVFKENELLQISVEPQDVTLLGNIYVGKVKNIVKNINAAFVEIEGGQMCYLSLNDKSTPVFLKPKGNEKICIGDELLVQISKDAIKTKNPSVTAKLQLAGKYMVLTHGDTRISVSSKITDENVRKDLITFVKEEVGKNRSFGIIIRTNAKDADVDVLRLELKAMVEDYNNIIQQGIHKTCFSKIYEAPAGYLCDIRDGYDANIESILTDERDIYEAIKNYLSKTQPLDLAKLQFHEKENCTLSMLYGIETKLKKALQEKVWLKSGGYLVIQPTEALTVIDVNTGKAVSGKKDVEKHFLKINCEAAKEIAKQLRLRNLSGIIVVDFIDMKEKGAKEILISTLCTELKKDSIKTAFVDMTKLNLVEITRKKVRKPLHEQWQKREG